MKSKIILKGLQIKNIEKAKKLAYALNIIEEECGIKNVKIVIKNMFVCEWIDTEELDNTQMEYLLKEILDHKENKKTCSHVWKMCTNSRRSMKIGRTFCTKCGTEQTKTSNN